MEIDKKVGIILIWFGFLMFCYWVYALSKFDKYLLELDLTKYLLSFFLVFGVNLMLMGVIVMISMTDIALLEIKSKKRNTGREIYKELKARGYSDDRINQIMGKKEKDWYFFINSNMNPVLISNNF